MASMKAAMVPFQREGCARRNVGGVERWITGMAGAALAGYGMTRAIAARRSDDAERGDLRTPGLLTLAGGGLMLRATTGFCPVYALIGKGSADADWEPRTDTEARRSLSGDRGIRLLESISINRPPVEVFGFWRNFENLPRFMQHLESVRHTDAGHSHWVVRGPAGTTVEWDAEVVNEEPGKLIGWQTLPGADVVSAGSVHFEEVPGDGGTLVNVHLQYQPPAGTIGAAVAKLLGEDPAQQVREDLARLKTLLETRNIH